MTDIALKPIGVGQQFDIAAGATDLVLDDGLETAVMVSLFTDQRASTDDLKRAGETDPRGWWGDIGDPDGVQIGSLLWLLSRQKITAEVIARAREYCSKALQWMIDDGIAASVSVETERAGLHQISIGITITKPDNSGLRYSYLWDGQRTA